jgi:hypothetical protein
MNKRSYLIDTAETPKDKKTLKADLKKLDGKFNPNRVASTSKTKTTPKATAKATAKSPVKKKVLVMPNKISPSKMTPAQKARYLKNPERYDG